MTSYETIPLNTNNNGIDLNNTIKVSCELPFGYYPENVTLSTEEDMFEYQNTIKKVNDFLKMHFIIRILIVFPIIGLLLLFLIAGAVLGVMYSLIIFYSTLSIYFFALSIVCFSMVGVMFYYKYAMNKIFDENQKNLFIRFYLNWGCGLNYILITRLNNNV
jgi:hypothetical protein